MIQICRFERGHTEGVRDLILPIQRGEFGIDITYADQPDLHDIADFYRKDRGEFWVALHHRDVVGSIALVDIGNDQSALRKMFVSREFRGGKHGVARRLLDELLNHAEENGLQEVYLGTTRKFLAAHRFYEKSGFELIEESALPETFPRMAVDTRCYLYRTDGP